MNTARQRPAPAQPNALAWSHDTTDPLAVTLELSKPFPRESLEVRDGLTYVRYPDMIRRLIRATGNRFSTRLVGHESIEAGVTGAGQKKLLLRAWVELDIPVLGSTRTHEGVQIAYPNANKGEDMFKGAISDAIKKAAQSYGVAIELTGADSEYIVNQRDAPAAPQEARDPTPPEVASDEPRTTTKPRGGGTERSTAAGTGASAAQLNMIRGLWKETQPTVTGEDGKQHHNAVTLATALWNRFSVHFDDITKEQASQVIDGLTNIKARNDAYPPEDDIDTIISDARGQGDMSLLANGLGTDTKAWIAAFPRLSAPELATIRPFAEQRNMFHSAELGKAFMAARDAAREREQ
ncbi:MAG TPA: hypothetical protein VNJ04_19620 [Gemmatimonadaceae bacterium]|nr:hypothetical protein [Gemmatimonadaceae bacterium]